MDNEIKQMLNLIFNSVKDLQTKMDAVQEKMTHLENRLDKLEVKISVLNAKVDGVEEQIASIDRQENRRFKILERDLNGALTGVRVLDKLKVDERSMNELIL